MSNSTLTNATAVSTAVVSLFYDYPRILGGSNQLRVDFDYFKGVGFTAIPYVAVGVGLALLLLLLLVLPAAVWSACAPGRARPLPYYDERPSGDIVLHSGVALAEPTPPKPSAPLAPQPNGKAALMADEEDEEPIEGTRSSATAASPLPPEKLWAANGAVAAGAATPAAAESALCARTPRACSTFFPPPLACGYLISVAALLVLLAAALMVALVGNIVAHTSLEETFGAISGGVHAVRHRGQGVVDDYDRATNLINTLISSPEASLIGISSSSVNISSIRSEAQSIYHKVVSVVDTVNNGLGYARTAEWVRFGVLLGGTLLLWLLWVLIVGAVYTSCRLAIDAWSDPQLLNSAAARTRLHGCCGRIMRLRLMLFAAIVFVLLVWIGLGISTAYGVLNGDLCTAAVAREDQLLEGVNLDGTVSASVPSDSLGHLIYCPERSSVEGVLHKQQRILDGIFSKLDSALRGLGVSLPANITLQDYQQVFSELESSGGTAIGLVRPFLNEGSQILGNVSDATTTLHNWLDCGPVVDILGSAIREQCNAGVQSALATFIGFFICSILGSLIALYVLVCSKIQNAELHL
ncbi:hypothetical protein CDCA_CDCA04G1215 [Cyanidium caldarium]|uniref:Uncharacterized protein n=1 Tax=Cyanidium caldarium TaxID=2771 RepID=A0AAV9ISB0_CYACA|nr:hypothetical protein CDCA_CDCA04G1215 [Cyanidium caldarium]